MQRNILEVGLHRQTYPFIKEDVPSSFCICNYHKYKKNTKVCFSKPIELSMDEEIMGDFDMEDDLSDDDDMLDF